MLLSSIIRATTGVGDGDTGAPGANELGGECSLCVIIRLVLFVGDLSGKVYVRAGIRRGIVCDDGYSER